MGRQCLDSSNWRQIGAKLAQNWRNYVIRGLKLVSENQVSCVDFKFKENLTYECSLYKIINIYC